MKKLLIAMLFAAVLVAQASPLRAQYYSSNDALNKILKAVDSTATAAYAPTPVAVSEHQLFSGLNMINSSAGSLTNLRKGRRTYPITAGPSVAGAKALDLVISWSNFEHGGFRIQHIFSPSATDTSAFTVMTSAWDTFSITDSSTLASYRGHIPRDTSGCVVFHVPNVPAGDVYYFTRIWPWDTLHVNYIANLAGTLREMR